MQVSLIVLTYNWPEALTRVLRSVAKQSHLPDEVIVADDGSSASTLEAVKGIARYFPCRIAHIWQEDRGFRAARARNRGIAAARGEYVVLVDGDMLLHPCFVADHVALARRGCFLQGGRLRATAGETQRLLAGGQTYFTRRMDGEFDAPHEFRRHHAIRLPRLARIAAYRCGHVMSCNMSFWLDDLVRVNGFDEHMHGYGSEDLELAERLRNAGVRQRQIKYAALAVHLHHATRAPIDPNDLSLPNNQILKRTRDEKRTHCELGLASHREEFSAPPIDLRDLAV